MEFDSDKSCNLSAGHSRTIVIRRSVIGRHRWLTPWHAAETLYATLRGPRLRYNWLGNTTVPYTKHGNV